VPADVRRQLLRLNASRVDQEDPVPTEDPFQKPRMKQERARARHRTNKPVPGATEPDELRLGSKGVDAHSETACCRETSGPARRVRRRR
jgi:hypothetical protein